MSGSDRIVYKVLTRDDRGWKLQGGIGDMAKAMKAADQLFNSQKFLEAKVDKEYHDARNDRTVTTTILHRKQEQKTSMLVPILLISAVVIVAASFAGAYLFGLRLN